MKLIKFQSTEEWNVPVREKDYIPLELENGQKVMKPVASDRIKEMKHMNTTYWVPENKLEWITFYKGNHIIKIKDHDPIRVTEETKDNVIEQLIKGEY